MTRWGETEPSGIERAGIEQAGSRHTVTGRSVTGQAVTGLTVLVADDEAPAREELAYLLGLDPAVSRVRAVASGSEVVRALEDDEFDALFLDVAMPGLDGIDVARLLSRFRHPPPIVFVTAHEEHAVTAFDLQAVDYVLKPVDSRRLHQAVARVRERLGESATAPVDPDETIAVELAGVTRFVARRDVAWVAAHGDYARLHTVEGSHLVRVPLTTLEQRWAGAGFVRIHRSHLVQLVHVQEVRSDTGHYSVLVAGTRLPVSRRHGRDLRDLLARHRAQPRDHPPREHQP